MQDDPTNRNSGSHTQWSRAEIARLKALAPGKPRKQMLLDSFPGRTLGAIRIHLCHIRRELGIPKRGTVSNLKPRLISGPPMLDRDDEGLADDWLIKWKRRATVSNQQFLAALAQAA